jgi:hypothetical protein
MRISRTVIFIATATWLLTIMPLLFAWLIFDWQQLVTKPEKISEADIRRIKRELEEYNPLNLVPGQIEKLLIHERDFNLLVPYLFSQSNQGKKLRGRLSIEENIGHLYLTYVGPYTVYRYLPNYFGPFVNIHAQFLQRKDRLVIEKLSIGSIPVPGPLIDPLLYFAHHNLQENYGEYRQLVEVRQYIEELRLADSGVLLVYHWEEDSLDRLVQSGQTLLSHEERQRLREYHDYLPRITPLAQKSLSLNQFIQPLFSFARQRTLAGGDPVLENKAALLTLAFYISGKRATRLLGYDSRSNHSYSRPLDLSLRQRGDLAQHFLISAAITIMADSETANMIGLFKEQDDARGGSGFSFADLAADRAGVRLAALATGSKQQALKLQERLSRAQNEDAYMPQIDQLPEGLMAGDFAERFKDTQSEDYKTLTAEIERRLDQCIVHQ